MKSAPFRYVRPDSIDEVLSLLAEHGSDARLLAGGQSLGAMLNMRIVTPTVLVDINGLGGLSGIRVHDSFVVTGAMTRQHDANCNSEIASSVPLLKKALPSVGHYQTRNRGTIGGSIAHADPSAEIPLICTTLGADIELRSSKRARKVDPAAFFCSALITAREPNEIVTAIHWPKARPSENFAFSEFAIREGDFAVVAVACVVDIQRRYLNLGLGGCGEVPQVVRRERVDFQSSVIEDLIQGIIAEFEYRGDLLASAAYRRQLAGVLAKETITRALDGEPPHA